MKIVATVEARMASSRLPGKVMLPAAGSPMLLHLIKRLKQVESLDDIVLATTANPADDVLIEFAKRECIFFFRGSENDVMERVVGAADSVHADLVVEITADCPIIDPLIVEQLIQMFLHNDCDYASNVIARSYPIGMDTQIFPLAVLKRSLTMT
ncbi:MAG: cytidylyltransferase domain-containing protein, partial [Methylococcales bacterium]